MFGQREPLSVLDVFGVILRNELLFFPWMLVITFCDCHLDNSTKPQCYELRLVDELLY